MKTLLRNALAVVTIISSAVAAVGCSSDSDAESQESTTASGQQTSEVDAGATLVPREDLPTAEAATASPSQSPSSGTELAAPAPPPAGYQTATAEIALVTFAVPEEWAVFEEFTDSENQEFAAILGTDVSDVQMAGISVDVWSVARGRNPVGFLENIRCMMVTQSRGVKDQANLSGQMKEGSDLLSYATVTTANGEGSYIIYRDATYDNETYTGLLALPNPRGNMAMIDLSSSTPERTQELTDVVVSSLR